ncbi:MAG: VWA domain-containing protein [Solobacterium sp.]|nr:VWA domain-containing protein [Solobacterium sp.]
MKKKILAGILSVLLSVTMHAPIRAEEPEQPTANEPEATEVIEAEQEDTAEATAAAEVSAAPEEEDPVLASEEPGDDPVITEEPVASEEPGEDPVITEEPAVSEDPEVLPEEITEEKPAEETPEAEGEAVEEETGEEEPEIFTVAPDPVTYNGVTVTVSYPSDTFGGKDVTLVVGEPGEVEKEALEALGGDYKAVDISFIDEEGNKVQPEEGKTVSVALVAEGMEATGEYKAVHVDAEGTVDFLEAETETSNEVTETVKTGETTKIIEVPAVTETVTVEDYREETYTDYETRETTVEVPAEIGYHQVLKTRMVEREEPVSLLQRLFSFGRSSKSKKTKLVAEYYYETEPYVIREAYTKTETETVPVEKTRTVLAGTHEETRVIAEAYSYEVTEDVYEEVTYNDVEAAFEAGSFSTYAVVSDTITNNEEYVIYTGTTALARSGNSLATATITVQDGIVRSDSDEIRWTFIRQSDNDPDPDEYRLQNGNRYLQDNSGALGMARGRDVTTNWIYDEYNHRFISKPGNRYLVLNGTTFTTTTNASQASTIYLARVEEEPVELAYYYYNAPRTASISATEIIPEEQLPTEWTDVADLAKDIPGYTFMEARANGSNGDIIGQINGDRFRRFGSNTEGDLESVYFIYMKDYVPGEDVIPGLNGPVTEKHVTHNDDGTFTIRLDVTGVTNPVKHGANIVIVFDRTSSMSGNMSNTDRTMRINAAISAVNTMVTTLNPGTGADQNDIDFALVEFDRNAAVYDFGTSGITGHTQWTKSGTALYNRVYRYHDGANLAASGATPGAGGTNWQAALQAAAQVLENKPDADPTYVIFMTDGEPTFYIGSTTVYNNRSTSDPEYYTAVPYAKAIVDADYLMYDIFCSASTTTLLHSLYTTSGAESYVMAETQTAIEEAFANVAQDMIDAIGSSNYAADDGVPELGSFDLDTIDGQLQLSEARYYKNGAAWADAPAAVPSAAGVKWDLTSVGTLENGTVYSIEFEVWPSQAAYDMIADLNNGKRFYDYADYVASGPDPVLSEEAAVAAGLVLTADQRSQIAEPASAGAEYTMKTNTSLSATYKLYGQTITEPDIDFTADAMDLPVEPISVKKIWPENMLDEYGAADFRDPATGETFTATEILLTLKRDGQNYMDILVKGSEGWKKDDIFVSNGFMTVETVDGEKVAHIKETGHDYQLVEPPAFMYYWDLVSDIYHPMVINGVPTILVYDQDKKAADVDNETYFAIGKNADNSVRVYKKQTSTDGNTLEGYNYRRSNLNLTKTITSGDPDALFTYTMTVKDSYSTDGYVWFSVWDPTANDYVYNVEVTGATKEIKDIPEGATIDAEAGTCTFINKDNKQETHPIASDGKYYTGYFYATNNTAVTAKIKAGWNLRFLNLYHGSTYSFEETGMPGNFEFVSVVPTTQWNFMHPDNANWYTIDATSTKGLITGTITEPNNNYTVTYTNQPKPEFYIYHSSVAVDGALETIPMSAVNADGTYDLFAHAKEGTLYGGYYLDYAGKGDYADDGVKGTTGVAYTGMNYEWTNPQTVLGTAMKPQAGVTYYIKEVPTYYLRNYHQITFLKTTPQTLTGLYLISAVDDRNYNETGFVLKSTDSKEATVVQSLAITNSGTGKTTTLKANTVFNSLGITEEGEYLTYWAANGSSYYAVGSFTVLPYWVTPDNITVRGISTRTITITSMTRRGVTKSDN